MEEMDIDDIPTRFSKKRLIQQVLPAIELEGVERIEVIGSWANPEADVDVTSDVDVLIRMKEGEVPEIHEDEMPDNVEMHVPGGGLIGEVGKYPLQLMTNAPSNQMMVAPSLEFDYEPITLYDDAAYVELVANIGGEEMTLPLDHYALTNIWKSVEDDTDFNMETYEEVAHWFHFLSMKANPNR